jgi:cation transport ATPase
VPGRGARAEVLGEVVRVGSPGFLEAEGVDLAPVRERIARLAAGGRAVLVVARGGSAIAVVALADGVKEQAAPEIARLIRAGATPD